ADHQNQAVCVRRLETLRQFQVNFFGFSALDVNGCLQATFDFVGKGQQRKRHDKPQHRQPESAARVIMASLQAWHYHGRSTSFLVLLRAMKRLRSEERRVGKEWRS